MYIYIYTHRLIYIYRFRYIYIYICIDIGIDTCSVKLNQLKNPSLGLFDYWVYPCSIPWFNGLKPHFPLQGCQKSKGTLFSYSRVEPPKYSMRLNPKSYG